MKIQLAILVLIAVVGLLPAVTRIAQTSKANQTLNPAYLGGMPTVERVMRDVKGNDSIDTAARQAGAFWQLRRAIYDMALSQHRSDRQATPDENRLTLAYYTAHNNVWEPIGKALAQDRPRLFKLQGYATDPGFLKELLEQLCTPAFRTEYYRAMRDLDARVQARKDANMVRVNSPTQGTQEGRTAMTSRMKIPLAILALVAVVGLLQAVTRIAQTRRPNQTLKPAYLGEMPTESTSPGVNSYLTLGDQNFDAKEYAKAIEAYQKAIALKPDSEILAGAYQMIGRSYMQLKQHEKALVSLRESFHLKPDDPETSLQLGLAYFAVKQFPNAAAAYKQAIHLKPDYASAHYALGLTYLDMGMKNEATQVYQKLQTLNQKLAQDLYNAMNQSTSKTPQSNAAPGTAEAYVAQGDNANVQKDYAQAIQAYKKAIALKPSLTDAYWHLAFAYTVQKQHQLAIDVFKQILVLTPRDEGALLNLGIQHIEMKQYQEALPSFQEALRLRPDFAEAHYRIGETYCGLEQYEKAITPLQQALRLKTDYADASNQLGLAYFNLKQYSDAVAAFKQTVRFRPSDAQAQYNLGVSCVLMGKKDDALQVFRTLLSLDNKLAHDLFEEINKMK